MKRFYGIWLPTTHDRLSLYKKSNLFRNITLRRCLPAGLLGILSVFYFVGIIDADEADKMDEVVYSQFNEVHPSRIIGAFRFSMPRHDIYMIVDTDSELPLLTVRLPMGDVERSMEIMARELLENGIVLAYYKHIQLCVFVELEEKERIVRLARSLRED